MTPLRAALLLLPLALGCGEPSTVASPNDLPNPGPTTGQPPADWQDNFVQRARYLTEVGHPGPQFVEILDVQVAGEQLLVCAATQGLLAVRRDTLTITDAVYPSVGGPRCQHVVVDGEHVLMANRGDEFVPLPHLAMFGLSPQGQLQELAVFGDGTVSYEGLAVIAPGRYATALHDNGVALIEFDGEQLREVERIGGFTNAWHVQAHGEHLFVADSEAGVRVVALHPRGGSSELLTTLSLPGAVQHLELAGDDLLLASAGAAGVHMIDISTPSAPVLTGTIDTPGSALKSAFADDYVYIADWTSARVYDLHDRQAPFLEAIETPDVNVFARVLALDAEADRAYLGEWTGLYDYQLIPGMHAPDIELPSFGMVFPQAEPNEPIVRGLTIRNAGTEPLTITGVEPGDYFTPVTTALSILPGEEGSLDIRFSPEGDWQHDSSIILHSDDPDESAVWLPMKGNGYGLSVGDPIPAYEWLDLISGEPIKMQALFGKVVVISYFATF